MQIKVKKLHKNAIIPKYQTQGAACFDIHAIHDGSEDYSLPTQFAEEFKFRTGLSFEIPEGYVMLVYSRSGHGFKNNVRLANCVGVIDSDYRGELLVKLTNDSFDEWFEVKNGDRIAQAMIIPVQQVSFEEVSELSDTIRGEGGFGSSGR